MNQTIIHGIYDDDALLLDGAKALRAIGIKVKEVFSPIPVHGLDPVIGVKKTRLAICSFLYGCTGTSLALLMMWYMMIHDWPIDIGGKPNEFLYRNIPSFIPITFEITVLCAAHGMALTFLFRSWIFPGVSAKNPDKRTTDDKFLMLIEARNEDVTKIVNVLKETGASEVNQKSA